jgi:hypothetical protein
VVLAGDAPPLPGCTYLTGTQTPLLVVHCVADPTVPCAEGRSIFINALPPETMLTVPARDVPSADHARPYVGKKYRPLPDGGWS